QPLRPIRKFVVMIPLQFHTESAGTLTHIVTESLILQTIYAPATASQSQCLTDYISFQSIRESAPLIFFCKINLNISLTRIIDIRLKLPNFLEIAQISFHPLYQHIHLL